MKKLTKPFVIISIISITLLLISNIIAGKLINFFGITLPASVILFPITYVIGDILAEVYGYKSAKFTIMMGFISNAIMVIFFLIAINIEPASTWTNQEAFATILGTTPRLFLGSLCAYLCGSLTNAFILNKLKLVTKENMLWIRTIGSTMVGEFIDTVLFEVIVFGGIMETNSLIIMIFNHYLWKLAYEVIATPLVYVAVAKIRKIENIKYAQ